jgi:peptidoglycan hydrolase-like protein with peptidoglycan-binding domain
MGDTDRDSWNCEDTGCRDTRLYRFTNNKWTDTAICLRELPLTRFASSCFVPNVGLATIDLIPPQDVACILWPTNSHPKFVKETQCVLNENEVLKSFDTKCEGFFEKTTLPLEKCHQGALVQQALTKLQQLKYVRNVDIYFGPEMARAVFEFQTDNNLARTGILDDDTWNLLNP